MKNIKVNIPDEIDTIRIGVGEIRVGFMLDDVPIYFEILHHDGHVIDTENSDLEKGIITFKKEESKYPMELVDVFKDNTLVRLVETCKEWNRIDGFEADWTISDGSKFCLYTHNDNIIIDGFISTRHALYFQHRKTAELFLETFREEIELVKDLI